MDKGKCCRNLENVDQTNNLFLYVHYPSDVKPNYIKFDDLHFDDLHFDDLHFVLITVTHPGIAAQVWVTTDEQAGIGVLYQYDILHYLPYSS